MVAHAAPATPIFKGPMKMMSSTRFMTEAMQMNINGRRESPIPRSADATILYPAVKTSPAPQIRR